MQYTDILKYVNSKILWAYDVDNQQITVGTKMFSCNTLTELKLEKPN